jgi:isopenicillin N synthase-like dioxygenase
MNTSIENLETAGFVNVPYPASLRKSVEAAVERWKAFCAQSEEARMSVPYLSKEGMGVGYELKKTPGANLDLKEDFHFSPGSAKELKLAVEANSYARELVVAVENLSEELRPLISAFALEIEKAFGLAGFKEEIEQSEDEWFLRFLHYFGDREEGEEIATAHADKSGFTLHLYESDPGLQYLDRNYQWQDLQISNGETAIILGMRGQYRSEGRLKATFHRVIATPITAKRGRFSMVVFVHPKNTPAYDKARAGRLQEFQPGFNYEMPFEEFAKLFKK